MDRSRPSPIGTGGCLLSVRYLTVSCKPSVLAKKDALLWRVKDPTLRCRVAARRHYEPINAERGWMETAGFKQALDYAARNTTWWRLEESNRGKERRQYSVLRNISTSRKVRSTTVALSLWELVFLNTIRRKVHPASFRTAASFRFLRLNLQGCLWIGDSSKPWGLF